LNSTRVSKGEIDNQVNERMIRGYLCINLNNYNDIQHIPRDKMPDFANYKYEVSILKDNYVTRYEDHLPSSGNNIIYDRRDKNNPKQVYETSFNKGTGYYRGHYLWGQWWSGMKVQGNILYGCTKDDLLAIYDISSIQSPKRLGSIAYSNMDKDSVKYSDTPDHLTVYGNLLIIQYARGIAMVDVSTPTKPVLLGECNVATMNGFMQGDYYYAWNYSNMYIFDTRRLTR
jgi:hypothetical protein